MPRGDAREQRRGRRASPLRLLGLSLAAPLVRTTYPPAAGAARAADADWHTLSVDAAGFRRLIGSLLPKWHVSCAGAAPFLETLFTIFRTDERARPTSPPRGAVRPPSTWPDQTQQPGAVPNAPGVAHARRAGSEAGRGAVASASLGFERLAGGIGWLLCGASERRAQLCFECFDSRGVHHMPCRQTYFP